MIHSNPLNRGISNLISSEDNEEFNFDSTENVQLSTSIESLYPNPDQPRKTFSPDALSELTESIVRNGVLQPILVRPHPFKDNAYEIIAGERRWQAANKANLSHVPIIVKDLNDSDVIEIAMIENIHRDDLTAIEEANGYKLLIDQFDYTQEKLSQIISRSRSHIANTLRLLNLPTTVQKLMNEKLLTMGHARVLVGRKDAEKIANKIVEQGLSVRQTEALFTTSPAVEKIHPKEPQSSQPIIDPNIQAIQKQMSHKMGMSVQIKPNGNKGKVIIQYQNLQEFDAISKLLNP